jgi:hypothetical protein
VLMERSGSPIGTPSSGSNTGDGGARGGSRDPTANVNSGTAASSNRMAVRFKVS